jgi:uncharacterized protein YjaZ
MSLFTNTSVKEFEEKVKQYQQLINEEHLQTDDLIKKKQYIQICTKLDQQVLKYTDLAQIINVCLTQYSFGLGALR